MEFLAYFFSFFFKNFQPPEIHDAVNHMKSVVATSINYMGLHIKSNNYQEMA